MKSKHTYEALKFRKTPQGRRDSYTYEFADGKRVTVLPDEDGCTEIDIRRLHSIDDHEVYVNIKSSRPPVEEWQKPILEQWKKDNPDEMPVQNWNISLDSMLDSEGGEDDAATGYLKKVLYRTMTEDEAASSPTERMKELVSAMSPRLQAVYQLAMLDRIPNTQVAAMLGVSEGMIRKNIKAIEKVFREDKILKTFFR